jgi:hypothetical protein
MKYKRLDAWLENALETTNTGMIFTRVEAENTRPCYLQREHPGYQGVL